MTQAIEKFDPSTLMQGVKDRVKATFVSLIPEEQWEAMVKKEIEYFFEERRRDSSYFTCSDFRKVCNEVMTEAAREQIKEHLEKYKHEVWNSNTNLPDTGETLKGLLIKNAPEIFVATFGNMMQQVVYNMKNRSY